MPMYMRLSSFKRLGQPMMCLVTCTTTLPPTPLLHYFKKPEFKVEQDLPMPYDSYYISLLSQKHQAGNNNYLKTVLQGWKSNQ